MKARIVIGANYGDEGKGTVVAHLTKKSEESVLNVLTNGGAQRGHSILTENGSMTFQHFGSGTYHGADSYYSRFFILNPIQFVKEYESLLVKPKHIYRDPLCRWSTPYDSMANLIMEQAQKRQASCGMGIWNTVKRYQTNYSRFTFDEFMKSSYKYQYLLSVRMYYESFLTIPSDWISVWASPGLMEHFVRDCEFMYQHTTPCALNNLNYGEMIFENGQGLLLSDTGKDTYDTTPSDTGINYSLQLLKGLDTQEVTAHYVTRPYLTRHGDGEMMNQSSRELLSSSVQEDRTNHFNKFQGDFRYGNLDINDLHERIIKDARGTKVQLEVTHCDEMDRVSEFKKIFDNINTYDSPLI